MSPRDERPSPDEPTAEEAGLRDTATGSDEALHADAARLAEPLSESESQLRAFAESTADGILFHDGGRIVDANGAFLELSGYSLEELRELGLLDLVAPEDRALASWHIESRSGEIYELRGLRKDGTTVPLSARARDITYLGRPGRIVWLRDLSERHQVLGALRRSEDRYRQLFETCPDGIYVADLGRRLVAVNPAMVELFGYSSAEALLDADPRSLYSQPSYRKDFLERLFAEGTVREFAAVMLTREGRRLEVRETANLVRDESGEVVGYQGILRDVTEQHRLEQLLTQGQKMEAIGRLAGGVAHDFNNILTAISGFAELALVGLEPEHAAADDVQEIQQAAERARRLTGQLLDFSRRQVQKPQRVDLNTIIHDFKSFLERTLGSDIEISFALAPDLPAVLADPVQVEQVLMNLAINSRAAMPAGGRLEIVTRHEEVGPLEQIQGVALVPGGYSSLIVRDNGVGMEESIRSRAFEPFFSTRSRSKGTGLGLATVYGIVKQSQGYVWIDSAPGQGTTFTILLPQAVGEEGIASAPPEADSTKVETGSETVLLVEDDDGVREFSRRCLEARGYDVLVAPNAKEARRICDQEARRIDIMVTDIVMPGGDGVTLARDIRARHPAVAILLVSGYPDRALSLDAEAATDFPLLAKPFGADQLAGSVRQLLDGRT
jgi:PAS domain S-box-containing protein